MNKVVKYTNNFLTSSEKGFPFFFFGLWRPSALFHTSRSLFSTKENLLSLQFSQIQLAYIAKSRARCWTYVFLEELKALTSYMPHNLNLYITKRYVLDHTFVMSSEENIKAGLFVICSKSISEIQKKHSSLSVWITYQIWS